MFRLSLFFEIVSLIDSRSDWLDLASVKSSSTTRKVLEKWLRWSTFELYCKTMLIYNIQIEDVFAFDVPQFVS